ncbi:MAG: hypothetical protein ACRCUQ_03000 [Alphaproteobacteria bacterium]
MKSVVLAFLTCLASYGWASPLPANIPDTASNVARQKFSTAGTEAPLDEKHPAIRAANRIEDPQNKETALKLSHVFRKNINLITDWLKNRIAHADNIYSTWEAMTPEERPILTSCELWWQEIVSIEELSIYLKESWRGSPLVVGDDYHAAVLYIQQGEGQNPTLAHFYDPYEPFERGSLLGIKTKKKVVDAFGNSVKWLPHYTKHQKLTAFGECSLYASAYRSFLLKGQKPDELTDEVVFDKVASLKEVIREQHPEYFKNYDGFFQFAFDSGFAKFLLEEIKADASL